MKIQAEDIIKQDNLKEEKINVFLINYTKKNTNDTINNDFTTNTNNNNINDINIINSDLNNYDVLETKSITSEQLKPNFKKDKYKILFFTYLYFLQGIVYGLASAIPLILSSKKVSFTDIGTFSLVTWPFFLKVLWSPLADSIYIKAIGRRKTWFITCFLIIGVIMISVANVTKNIFDGLVDSRYAILELTLIFGAITLLSSMAGIAIDGFGLSKFSKENFSWLGTTKKIGQTSGQYVSNQIFLILESKNICNNYIRPLFKLLPKDYGILTIERFLLIFGCIFILTCIVCFIFVSEKAVDSGSSLGEKKLSILKSYKLLLKILKLKPMKYVILFFLTYPIAFGIEDAYNLKLIKNGVPKEYIALISLVVFPFLSIFSLFITKFIRGANSLTTLVNLYPIKLFILLTMTIWASFTDYFKESKNNFSIYFYIVCLILQFCLQFVNFVFFCLVSLFFSRITDQKIGGTYLSFLNTVNNCGFVLTETSSLKLIGLLSIRHCSYNFFKSSNNSTNSTIELTNTTSLAKNTTLLMSSVFSNRCLSICDINDCYKIGGQCVYIIDAFLWFGIAFAIVGIVWMILFRSTAKNIESQKKNSWLVYKSGC